MKWFIKCLGHYADFGGRARRREFWMFTLFNLIVLFLWSFTVGLVVGRVDDEAPLAIVYAGWFGLTGLPAVAVAVRRLHDLGKSGRWLLIGLIPFVGGIWLFHTT